MANPNDYCLSDGCYGAGINKIWIYQRLKSLIYRRAYFVPTNPQTVEQQANRSKLANAVSSWQGLSEEDKNIWRKQAKIWSLHMTGFNLYIKYQMLDKEINF